MTTPSPPHDCCSAAPAGLVSFEAALELLLAHAHPLTQTEGVPTAAGLGRVLAAGVESGIDVPAWDHSAMDGYAVRSADLIGESTRLTLAQRIPAGGVGSPLAPGTAARIFTGAPVPPGADAVVIQEVYEAGPDWVLVPLVKADLPDLKLQSTPSLVNPDWTDVPGSLGTNRIELPLSTNPEFFRLIQPQNAP